MCKQQRIQNANGLVSTAKAILAAPSVVMGGRQCEDSKSGTPRNLVAIKLTCSVIALAVWLPVVHTAMEVSISSMFIL